MVAATTIKSLPDIARIEPFNETHYKRWQEKVMSILDATSYVFVITDPKPEKEKEYVGYRRCQNYKPENPVRYPDQYWRLNRCHAAAIGAIKH